MAAEVVFIESKKSPRNSIIRIKDLPLTSSPASYDRLARALSKNDIACFRIDSFTKYLQRATIQREIYMISVFLILLDDSPSADVVTLSESRDEKVYKLVEKDVSQARVAEICRSHRLT